MDINNLIIGRKGKKGRSKSLDSAIQRKILREYLEGDLSSNQLGEKYGINGRRIFEWRTKYGSEYAEPIMPPIMTEQEHKDMSALEQQVAALKKSLEYERMKNFALETMADLAKSELGIDIRKNSGAKQPKE